MLSNTSGINITHLNQPQQNKTRETKKHYEKMNQHFNSKSD